MNYDCSYVMIFKQQYVDYFISIIFYHHFRILGLMGSSDWEDAKIDMVVDCTADLLKPLFSHIFEKDEDRKVLSIQDSFYYSCR